MSEPNDTDLADAVFRALASRPRRQILIMLATGAGEGDARCCGPYEVCSCRFAEDLGLTAQTVSHHMKKLVEAGLVCARKQGLWVQYRLRREAIAAVIAELARLACVPTGDFCVPWAPKESGVRDD